jgi:hypothetical protein
MPNCHGDLRVESAEMMRICARAITTAPVARSRIHQNAQKKGSGAAS